MTIDRKPKTRNPKTTAFTLVELLVVITIIGILIALLLPAVQAAREAARRMQCGNNLKQHALGVMNYESTYNTFPHGAILQYVAPWGMKGSIFVRLLPFIEQQALYDAFNFKLDYVEPQTFPGTTQEIRAMPISSLNCPSDPRSLTFEQPASDGYWTGTGRTVAQFNYGASAGSSSLAGSGSCNCGETPTWDSYALGSYDNTNPSKPMNGPFNRIGISVGLNQITDGLSNTIMFGEILPLSSQHAQRGWVDSSNGCGLFTTAVPINYDTSQREPGGDNCHRYCNAATEWGFKSLHSGTANFAFCDGSVQTLSTSINHQLYQYLGSRNDGHPISGAF
jgi:prepilin-type processing-associated H-X9-DG protein/prepilin-type N-terminal cleavage/methylation domain-containing protein